MTTSIPSISARDALSIAYENSRKLDIEAADLPIAIKEGNEVRILVMFFGPGGPPPKGYRPPDYAVTLTLDGKVVKAGPTSAKELGIVAPGATQPGVGTADDLTVEDFISKAKELLELSPKVWGAFAAGRTATDSDVRPLLAEYWRLFNLSTANGIAPFYLQASPAFFAWVRSAVGAPNP